LIAVLGCCCLLVGCVAEKEFVKVSHLVIPEVDDDDSFYFFTPDGEENNFFIVESRNGEPVSLKVYTRQGLLVFSLEAKLCAWDGFSLSGQPMAGGVYYYTAEVLGSSPKISKCGFVHLYR